jgi:hypothetical protein
MLIPLLLHCSPRDLVQLAVWLSPAEYVHLPQLPHILCTITAKTYDFHPDLIYTNFNTFSVSSFKRAKSLSLAA